MRLREMIPLSKAQEKYINDLTPGGLFLTPAQFSLLSKDQARCLIQFLVLWKGKLILTPRRHKHFFKKIKKMGKPGMERFLFYCGCGEIKQETLLITRDYFGHRIIKRERAGFNSKTNV